MTSPRRILPKDPKDFLRSIVPFALVGLGAVERGATLVVLGVLIAGAAIAIRRSAPVRWAWAGAIPAATLPILPESGILGWITSACADLDRGLVGPAVVRALAITGIVFALALILRADRDGLWVRLPARRYVAWIPAAAVIGFVASFAYWRWIDGPRSASFPWALESLQLDAVGLLLALIYAVGSAVALELAMRGALLAWSARVTGLVPAILGQATIAALPSVALLSAGIPATAIGWTFAGAALLGLLAARTRSLAIPIAAQAGSILGFYVVIACT